jgi:hypothetical protein
LGTGNGKVPFGAVHCATFDYDSAGKVFLLMKRAGTPRWNYNKPAGVELWAYSAKERKWNKLKPGGKLPQNLRGAAMGYYDPEHNVFVNHCFPRGPAVSVYRYRRVGR